MRDRFGKWESDAKDQCITKAKALFLVQNAMSRPSARLALMDS